MDKAGSARVVYDGKLGNLEIRPTAAIDYVDVQEGAYEEFGGGDAVDLQVDERNYESLRASASISIAQPRPGDITTFTPEIRAGVRTELAGDAPEVTARFVQGGERFTVYGADLPELSYTAGFGLSWVNDFSAVSVAYDLEAADGVDFLSHNGRVVLRLQF